MHQEKAVLAINPIGKWYNFVWVVRYVLMVTCALMMYGKPRTVWLIYWVVDLLMIVFTVMCLKSFMNICGILIIVEEVMCFIIHFVVFLMFCDAPDADYKVKTVKFWMIVCLFAYLIIMLIEIILLFMGGKTCFKPSKNASNVQQNPGAGAKNDKPSHFKVELPDSAKANLK